MKNVAERCILINFSPFHDRSYYCKNTNNIKHMSKAHSWLQPQRPGDALSHMSSAVGRNQQAPPWPPETPTPSSRGLHTPSAALLPHSPQNSQASRVAASGNPTLIILLGKEGGGRQRKGAFSHLGRMLCDLPEQCMEALAGWSQP